MKIHYLLPTLLLMGCASSHTPVADLDLGPLPQKSGRALDQARAASIRLPELEKAYPVGRYQDPDDPSVMHEGHTVYRLETTPTWNLAPNAPTALPLGPTVAVADPNAEHVTLTAELEEKLQQEDQLLQVTYAQNQRLADEIKKLQQLQPQLRLPDPPDNPPPPQMAPPESTTPTNAPPSSPNPPVNPSPGQDQTTSWWQWLWSRNNPNSKGKT
ncbi:MAG TPA: hypothetical protein VGC39_01805 [Candidatus Methylacidiphilales bacterium]